MGEHFSFHSFHPSVSSAQPAQELPNMRRHRFHRCGDSCTVWSAQPTQESPPNGRSHRLSIYDQILQCHSPVYLDILHPIQRKSMSSNAITDFFLIDESRCLRLVVYPRKVPAIHVPISNVPGRAHSNFVPILAFDVSRSKDKSVADGGRCSTTSIDITQSYRKSSHYCEGRQKLQVGELHGIFR